MPGKPPADFIAVTNKMSTAQLERALGPMKEKAESGDRIAQDIVGWTEGVLKERARTENQLVIGADGHSYTQREYREKRERDNNDAELGAMTGNFASALVFKLSGDAHLAQLAGGLFSAAGGTAKGYNENRQMGTPDPAAVSPPGGSPPSRDVEPSSRDQSPPSEDGSGNTGGEGSGGGSAVAPGTGGDPGLEGITFKGLLAFAEKIYGLPDDVIAAARELTRAGVPPTEATADFLSLFAAGARSSTPSSTDVPAASAAPAKENSGDQSKQDDAPASEDGAGGEGEPGDDQGEGAPGALAPAAEEGAGSTEGSESDDSNFNMEQEAAEAEAELESDDTSGSYDMRQDISGGVDDGAEAAGSTEGDTSDDGVFNMEREAAEAEAQLESDGTPSTYDMRQDIPGSEAAMPSPTGPTPASDTGSTSENSGDLSYLDDGDGAGRQGREGPENDSSDDQGQLAYLDDHAKGPEMSYLDGPGGAEDSGSPEGEAGVAEDASGSGYDGGDSGGGEAVAAGGAAGAA